jgi:hypothetical protein
VTITEFLRARLDEDEAAARACADNDGNLGWFDSPVMASLGDHTIRTDGNRPVARIREVDSRGDDEVPRILDGDAVAIHVARHDPARVLREAAAKRAILARHIYILRRRGWQGTCRFDNHHWPCADVVDLAAVYRAHPDYDPAWASD